MSNKWGLGNYVVPHQANWQVRGIPNADQQARMAAGEYIEALWYGPMQQEPYASTGDLPTQMSIIRRLKEYLPELAAIRLPFNINNWGTYGTRFAGPDMRITTENFLAACKAYDVAVHICLMDGPSQRDAPEELPHPKTRTLADWLAWSVKVNQRQILSHQMFMDWARRRSDIMPRVWAAEFINEPDSYNVMANAINDKKRALAVYAMANVEIAKQVYLKPDALFQDAWLFVGGFNYSARFDELAQPNQYLPNGQSALQYIRDNIPAARLCWSMHAYSGWVGSFTQAGQRLNFRRRLGGLTPKGIEDDRICITETNVRHDVVFRYPWVQDGFQMFNMMRNGQWFAEKEISIGWWTAANYAQARLIQIQTDINGIVRMDEGYSHGAYYYMASFRNNPVFFTSAQNGEKAPDFTAPLQRWQVPEGSDEAAELRAQGWLNTSNGSFRGIAKMARGFGGRGTVVLRGLAECFNVLCGGDGWNAIYGAPDDEVEKPAVDFLTLGRGGGVLRSPMAQRTIMVSSTHTPSRLYLGPGKTEVVLFDNTTNHTTIVVEPSSVYHSIIPFFVPNRDGQGNGDRVSFRRAFASVDALMNAVRVELPKHTGASTEGQREDLIVDLPGGGSVRFVNNYSLIHILGDICLDFTDNWYGPGWVEPTDYDPAELSKPAPAPGVLQFAPLTYDEEAGGGGDDPGGGGEGNVSVRDSNGNPVTVRTVDGSTVAVNAA